MASTVCRGTHAARRLRELRGELRVRSPCRFDNRGTDYVRESGMKRVSVSTKRQCNRTLGELRPVLREARASDLRLRVQVRQRSNLLDKVHRSHRCIGAKVYRNVVPWHPLHRRQWGIPMHSYEKRSQIRALIWWERGSIARINLKGPEPEIHRVDPYFSS